MDCAYALLLEGWTQTGADLLSALERLNDSLGLAEKEPGAENVPTPAQNDRALQELEKLMANLG